MEERRQILVMSHKLRKSNKNENLSFQDYYFLTENSTTVDKIQTALDVAGFEPTLGTAADAANTIISGLRAALSKESDERKKHIINAGISAISMIPFADVIKILKLRKFRPFAKLAVKGARNLKDTSKTMKLSDRFNTQKNSEMMESKFLESTGENEGSGAGGTIPTSSLLSRI